MGEQVTAYCVKERAKRPIKDVREVTFPNGKRALQGVCPVCGTKLTRFLPDKQGADGSGARSKAASRSTR